MPRLSKNERERALGMLTTGWSLSRIATHFNVAVSTITRLRQRFAQTGSSDDCPRTGAPRVTTPDQDRDICLQHLRNPFLKVTRTAAATPGRHNQRISDQTVRNRLHESGLRARRPCVGHILNQGRKQARRQWVAQRVPWPAQRWRSTLFTDESRFCLSHGDGRDRVWRRQ